MVKHRLWLSIVLVMTVLQKITNSKNTAVFTLHREGIFYKCYNEDAMVFYERVKAFKITCKLVKRAGSMVYPRFST